MITSLMATLTVAALLIPSWRGAVIGWKVDQVMERLDPLIGPEDPSR